jgi:hypothetical protein
MAEIGGRPVDVLGFAIILGFLIGGISVALVYYVLM